MDESYSMQKGILIPDHVKQSAKPIKTRNHVPLSVWQHFANGLFYQRDDSPLDHIGTLGSSDPFLPRAVAQDFLNNKETKTVHEIGPGNFDFARHFVDTVKLTLEDIAYHGHDFSDASYAFVQDQLGKEIVFHKRSLDQFPDEVKDDPLYLILTEVLDDTLTEFYIRHDDTDYILCVTPTMKSDVHFPNKTKAARLFALHGDLSKHVSRLAQPGKTEKEYTAQDIIDIIDSFQLDALEDIYPSFLHHLTYPKWEFNQIPIDEAPSLPWRKGPGDFKEYGHQVLSFFKDQLSRAKDTHVVSIPLAGVALLWKLRERKNINIHFFDYGYKDIDEDVGPFAVYNGQITAPVNFGVLQHAAELLGFNTTLEKNQYYIKRMLGEDTVKIGYIQKVLDNMPSISAGAKQVAYGAFQERVQELNPGENITEDAILNYRVRREEMDKFIAAAKNLGKLKKDFTFTEGSYHLAVSK